MRRILLMTLMGVFCALFLAGHVTPNATAQKGDKTKRKLPIYFGSLGLSDEQKLKVYKIQEDYNVKEEALKKQLEKLKADEKVELVNVLNEGQKEKLRKIYIDKIGLDPFAPPKKEISPPKKTGGNN